MYFADNVNGGAVGQSGTIIKTSDSGANWISQTSGLTSSLISIHFINSNTGWIAGVFCRILQTSNGGINWNLYQHHRYLSLHSVFFIDAVEGWGVGDSGQMLKTTNGGGAGGGEPEERVVIDEKFDGTQFPPNGWAVNQTHQTNTWMAGNITDQNFSSIDPTNVNSAICPWIAANQDEWLITPSFALASGSASIEFYAGHSTQWLSAATLKLNISTNGGTNWTQIWEAVNDSQPWGWRYQNVDITQYANNSNMKLAWQYVGNDGDAAAIDNVKLTGFVTVTDVKEEESERIPNNYELSQNYPNPFNPSTKINYSIPANSKVSLIVYDILGREIKTLVNEFQSAGRYSIEFNAKGLASGIYFYRLTSGQFSETQKLILLR